MIDPTKAKQASESGERAQARRKENREKAAKAKANGK